MTEFAGRLRAVRLAAGQPSYRRLSAATHYSAATLARAAGGQSLPSLEVTLAYVAACGADPDQWRAAWDEVAAWARSGAVGAAVPDPGPEPGPASAPAPVDGGWLAVPRELPAGIRHFTGRAGELAALTGLLDRASEAAPETVVISAIGGTAGVGKTALAVHWAYQVAGRFPDGQLYVNLRGYDPAQPMTAADALAGFLRALGLPGQEIPAETEERAARYRSLLAVRRVLVVLDNAGSVEQVRPLLPGAAGCMVVVTSRDALAGLVARDGAQRLDLDVLTPAEAVSLLRALIGERADADPGATAALAAQCCLLPLALRVSAELAIARPADPLARLVSELAGEQRRLDLLDAGGDPRTGVRAVLSWSYRQLEPGAARAFRLLATHPGPDTDAYAVAALTGSTVEQARRMLDQLARAYLIRPAGPDRYGLHDLLRAYGRELAATQDTDEQRQQALTRLFDCYLHTAATAMDTLFPAERTARPSLDLPDVPAVPPVTDPVAARAWLDSERANLVAAAAHAADHGWPSHATGLAATLFRYLHSGGHLPEAIAIHAHGLRAARRTGDRATEASALRTLSAVELQRGLFREAAGHLQQALALSREAGDLAGQAPALQNLGLVDLAQGHYEQAAGHLQECLARYRELGDRLGEARALGLIGVVDRRQGRYQQAGVLFQQALTLSQKIGDRPGEADSCMRLGYTATSQGSYPQAVSYLRRALVLFRELGDRPGEAQSLSLLGDAERLLGRYQQAIGHCRDALSLSREIGERYGEATALDCLGKSLCADGQHEQARACHHDALTLATQDGAPQVKADSHCGLARSYLATGDFGQARHHWRHALSLYTGLGAPEADQVRAELAALENAAVGS